LPFLLSKQIAHAKAVDSNDEWICWALYRFRAVKKVDDGVDGGTVRLI
jgi:hypothetical protein